MTRYALTTQADWQAGALPPQVDATSFPGDIVLVPSVVNVLTALHSEGDTVGFAPSGSPDITLGASRAVTTDEYWSGTTSLAVTTDGSTAFQGVAVVRGSTQPGTWTFSAHVKAPVGTPLRVIVRNFTSGVSFPPTTFTASGEWERQSTTCTLTAPSTIVRGQVTLDNYPVATTFYLDGLQLQQGALSPWSLGGSLVSSATITTKVIDLGAARSQPMHVYRLFTAPAGTSVTIDSLRTSVDGSTWGASAAPVLGMTPWAPSRFVEAQITMTGTATEAPTLHEFGIMDWDPIIGTRASRATLTGTRTERAQLTGTIAQRAQIVGVIRS